MSEGRHVPPGDRSFALSIGRHVGSAVLLVVVVAAAFWGIGQLRGDTPDPVISAPPTQPAPTATAPATDDPAAAPTDDPTDGATEPADTPTVEPTAEPTTALTSEPTPEPTPEASPSAAAPSGDVDPASISIQILDAVLDDGGEAVERVEGELEAAGYRVVATNKAVRKYTQTTVFYTEGNEDAARQIAAEFGYDAVEPKPDNLSSSVEIHLVVGADA